MRAKPSILTGARAALARWIAPPQSQKPQKRAYGGAQIGRLTSDWNPLNTSGDSELVTSLRALRSRSRQLTRDNEYALRAKRLVQNNVIGQGIGMQAQVVNQRGTLQDNINSQIEDAWAAWCDKTICDTAGAMHFHDIERMLFGELFEAGEALVRIVREPFGGGRTPLALEIIEADRLIDTWQTGNAPNGNAIRMGVEVDHYGRPQAYWLYPTHPGDYQFTSFQPSRFIRVPAADMIHLYVKDRQPQTRGVPWMHAALKRLNDMGGYTEAEIVAARAAANIMGIVETPEIQGSDDTTSDAASEAPLTDLQPGIVQQLLPGQKFTGFAPSRPNPAMDPFMRLMLRGVASATGVSYESLSRDYSQSNYSSSRLALLDDRDLWRVLQSWFIRNFREPVHREWLNASATAMVLPFNDYFSSPDKYRAVRFRPRGWSWIDPLKEVAAYEAAVMAGFMTLGDVIAATGNGRDLEEKLKERRAELDLMASMDLKFTTNADPVKIGINVGSALNASATGPQNSPNTGDPAGAETTDAAQQQEAA